MSLTERSIAFRLEGSQEDQGKVRLREFIEFLEKLGVVLRKVDLFVSGSERPSTYYRIVDLDAASASLTLEAVPYKHEKDYSAAILERMTDALTLIQDRAELPEGFDRPLLDAFRGVCDPLKKNVSKIQAMHQNKTIPITMSLEANIDRIIGEETTCHGSLTGHLDAVNVHDTNIFYLYPPVGPAKVLCRFPETLLDTVRKAIKCYINVIGTLRYKEQDEFPYQIDVEEIDIYPNEGELPTLRSLRGMAPDVTGNLDSVSFVRALRDASES